MGGSTNCMSSAVDISKWMLFHLSKGRNQAGQQIVREEDVEALHKRRNTITAPTVENYFSRPKVPVSSLEENYALGWKNGVYRGRLFSFISDNLLFLLITFEDSPQNSTLVVENLFSQHMTTNV